MSTVHNQTTGREETAFDGVASGENSTALYGRGSAVGVRGDGGTWHGAVGISTSKTGGAGVYGSNGVGGPGVIGESKTWHGVYGKSESTAGAAGVAGEHTGGGAGVRGTSASGIGLWAESQGNEAVHAETHAGSVAAIAAYGMNPQGTGAALYAEHKGAGPAGYFKGNVLVTGDLVLTGADLAEHVEVVEPEPLEPGTVVVLHGLDQVKASTAAYDRRVAGVVSGAGDFRPGLLLDHRERTEGRQPLALAGKVYCKVDASAGPIEIGDLLATAARPGHAMKASDRDLAFGAVLGKAMAPLSSGTGLLPILVALQ